MQYFCTKCDEVLQTEEEVDEHMLDAHDDEINELCREDCDICANVIKSKYIITQETTNAKATC
jgi:hypothetical protein